MRKFLVIFSLSFLLIGIFAFTTIKVNADSDEIDLQYSYIHFNSTLFPDTFSINTSNLYDLKFYSNGGYYTKIGFIRGTGSNFKVRYYKNDSIYTEVYAHSSGWVVPTQYSNLDSYRYISIVGGTDTDNDTLALFFQNNATITFNAESFGYDMYTEGYSDGEYDGYRDGYDDAFTDIGLVNLVDFYSSISVVAYDNNNQLISRAIRYTTNFDSLPLSSTSSIKSLKIYNIETDSSMSTINITISFITSFKFEYIYFSPLVNTISIADTDFNSFTQPFVNVYYSNVESSSISNSITFVINAQSYSSLNFYIMGFYADPNSTINAFNNGYNIGKADGIVIGKEIGYSEGVESTNFLGNSLLRVVDIPFKVFQQTFDFNVFGINLYHIVMGFLTLGVVLWFWKKLHQLRFFYE